MNSQQGIVKAVMETPCYGCQRMARYTVYHRASAKLLERLSAPIAHRDVHEVVWELERLQQQVPVGQCECGAPGQETTSAQFAMAATREDLDYVAPDLSYHICSLHLDGATLWRHNLDHDREDAPDPTPDKFRNAAEARARTWAECADLSSAALRKPDQASAYVRAKAHLFTKMGAEKYRRQDALNEPNASLDADDLAAIERGMGQLAEGHGFSAADPLEGVGIGGSHALVQALHLGIVVQSARRSEGGLSIIDTLLCQHLLNPKQQVTIFNRMPSDGE